MDFGLACLKISGIQEYEICQKLQNNIHDLLVMFEKQDIPAKLQKEEIETLKIRN